MRIPRHIVIKLEMAGKDTVKATEITDRCEIYEYEADEDEPQTERELEQARDALKRMAVEKMTALADRLEQTERSE